MFRLLLVSVSLLSLIHSQGFLRGSQKFLDTPSEDGEPRDFEEMKNDYCLVLSEKLPDSEEAQFSLLPMMTIGHLFELFNHGAQEPSRPFSLESK